MIVHVPTYSDQHAGLAEKLASLELEYWKQQTKILRERMETLMQEAINGREVTLAWKDKQVKLIPEHTALRMSGDIP